MTNVGKNGLSTFRQTGKSRMVYETVTWLIDNDLVKTCKNCKSIFVLSNGEVWSESGVCNECQPKGIE